MARREPSGPQGAAAIGLRAMIGMKGGGGPSSPSLYPLNGASDPAEGSEESLRQKVIDEILQTEADYVRDLKTVIDVRPTSPLYNSTPHTPHRNAQTHWSTHITLPARNKSK